MDKLGFPGGSEGKESACNAGDPGLIPGLRRSPGEGNGYPLQYSCLENSMDRGAWQSTVHWVAESGMTERITHMHFVTTTEAKPKSFYLLGKVPADTSQSIHSPIGNYCSDLTQMITFPVYF